MTQATRKIFINYRRDDQRDFVERFWDTLCERYGREHVFFDIETIPKFRVFEDVIRDKLAQADAVIAMIGPRWLEHFEAKRSNNEPDYVLMELETALRLKKVIAPICIKGAYFPKRLDLPASLQPLSRINAAFLDSGTLLKQQAADVIDALDHVLDAPSITQDAVITANAAPLFQAIMLERLPTALFALTIANANVREVPDLQASVLARLPVETFVRIEAITEDLNWYNVRIPDRTGASTLIGWMHRIALRAALSEQRAQ